MTVNEVGPGGRLRSVGTKGAGDVSQALAARNDPAAVAELVAEPPDGARRTDQVVWDNTADTAQGNPSDAIMSFNRMDGLQV